MLSAVVRRTVARPSSVRYINTTRPVQAPDIINDREKSLEDMDVKKHEQELLRKLKEKFDAQKQAQQPPQYQQPQAPPQKNAQAKPQKSADIPPPRSGATPEYLSYHEFLNFRKDMLEKIRDIEDEMIALKLKLTRP